MVDDVFPLLRLPEKASMKVLDCMEELHKISLSLCSTVTRNFVKSSGFHKPTIGLKFVGYFEIEIWFNDTYAIYIVCRNPGDEDFPQNVDITVDHIQAGYIKNDDDGDGVKRDGREYTWRKANFEVNDWIGHFQFVLSRYRIFSAWFDFQHFNLPSVKNVLKGLQIELVTIFLDSPEDYSYELVEVMPVVRHLDLDAYPVRQLPKILMQGFDDLNLSDNAKLDLDSLLMINSSYLTVYSPELVEKDLNRFIKLWIAKACCPRLEYIKIAFSRRVLNYEQVLKGVKCKLLAETDEKEFWRIGAMLEDELFCVKVNGGFKIKRVDGIEARIVMKEGLDFSNFEMFIWY